jgi:hypothetical protein
MGQGMLSFSEKYPDPFLNFLTGGQEMKIKSLLLGSAAASMLAVSGAQAADPIIYAEPEAMEYVRICDVYGAGYYYIPGTETCLQISGYVWYQLAANTYRNATHTPAYIGGSNPLDNNRWYKSSRARVNLDARSETELGTLRSYIRLQADWQANGVANDGNAVVDQAFIELGGLRMGYTEGAWVTSQSAGVASFGSHSWSGLYYGYQQRQLIAYTFTGANGLHATLSIENDTVGGHAAVVPFYGNGYMPDVVGVIGINQAWGGAWLKAGFDERINATQSAFGLQAGVQINVPNAPGSSLRVIGYYASGDTQYSAASPLGRSPTWSILGSYRHTFTPQFAATVGAQYFADLYNASSRVRTNQKGWAAEAAVIWTPVTNFEVRAEYGYTKMDGLSGTHAGFLRFTRTF